MTVLGLLSRLRALQVELVVDGERLRVRGPEGVLTPALRAELAARKWELVEWLRAARTLEQTPLIPATGEAILSFAQQRFWFFHNLAPDATAYHVCFGLRFQGALDPAALGRAVNEVVRRHEILRTVYDASDGRPRPIVLPPAPIDLPVLELPRLATKELTEHFNELAGDLIAAPFDLSVDPPLRLRLFLVTPDDHALVVSLHHIAADAWSVAAFTSELGALYDAFSAGRRSPLAELPIQYGDFASWQREQHEAHALDAQRDFWVEKLAGLPTLELPTDRPRPAFQSFRGGREPIALGRALTDALESLSRRHGATLFMTLLAAFAALLHRYTGQTDLAVGTAVAGRQRPELEPLIGPFINSLVLRTDASGDPTFRALLGRVREVALQAFAHQDLPFERVVDELQPERSVSRNPLFQVMLALQNVPMAPQELRELRLTPFDIDRKSAVSDLEIMFWPTPHGLEGYARYSADLFDAPTVQRLLERFEVLLEAVVVDPDRRLSALPMSTDADRRLLDAINATSAPYDRDALVHEMFERQAERRPDAIAIVSGSERLTYRELNARANRLARRLMALGVGADERVAICLDRSAAFVVAALAAMKAGGAYLPLDPAYPQERLAFMLADAAVPVVLTDRSLQARVAGHGGPSLCVDDPGIADESPADLRVPAHAQHLAYVIYTSGSTGRPKGVALSHRGLNNLVSWHQRVYQVTAADRAALVAGLGFDASVWEMWPYLTAGACVHIPDDETRASASSLLQWLADSAVTICFAPTPLAEAMIESPLPARLALRTLLTGGDKLHRVPAGLPFTLYNNYGPTENTVVSTWARVASDGSADPPPIGHPIANTRVHVLDRSLNAVPPGVPGELYVAGDGLARGYLAQPAITAAAFLPDPFAAAPGARMYRTGDLVRVRPDGNVEFIGRVDAQVKVRGFRIELGEIEAVLRQHPAVHEAVVITREQASGATRLLAYVVAAPGQSPDPGDVKAYLASRLPDYMVPAVFTWLPALPLTANGKIDRGGLPEPASHDPLRDVTEAFPRSDGERDLAEVWAKVLRLERVGVHDNFFEAGGDSILALQVIAAARQRGLRFTPRQIFEHPTVAALAAVAVRDGAVPVVAEEQASGDVPLTPIQRWFFEQEAPEPWHFNHAVMLVAREELDVARLEAAFACLLDHHDALRLRFVREAAGWRQYYAPRGDGVPLERIDLRSALPGSRAEMQATADGVQATLDLTNGPLMRAALFDAGPGEAQRLLIAIHHLVVDTVSWRVLLADLQQAYTQLALGPVKLPPKTASFKTWAMRLQAYAAAGLSSAEIAYWRDLAEVDGGIPIDFRGANTTDTLQSVSLAASSIETEALLRDVPKAYGMQIQEVLLAALARSFAAWTGRSRVLLDLENHGRDALFDDLDLSRTVGWFTAMYPIAIDLNGAGDPGAALKRIKEQARGVPARGTGYGVLRYLRGAGGASLHAASGASVSFNYLGQFDVDSADALWAPAAEPAGAVYGVRMPRAHLIDVSAHVASGLLRLTLHYSEAVHRRSTIEALGRSIVAELGELIRHCRTSEAGGFTPSDFPEANVTQDELDRLLARIGQAGSYS